MMRARNVVLLLRHLPLRSLAERCRAQQETHDASCCASTACLGYISKTSGEISGCQLGSRVGECALGPALAQAEFREADADGFRVENLYACLPCQVVGIDDVGYQRAPERHNDLRAV